MNPVAKFLLPALICLAGQTALADEAEDSVDPDLRDALKEAVEQSNSFNDRFEAEVWLMDMSSRLERWVPDRDKRLRILRKVHAEARMADLEPELVLAVIHVESRFDRFAISRVGARGMMQIMPFWLEEIGRPEDNLFDLQTNLRYGVTILRYYLDKENGNLSRALARYNGSLGSMRYPSLVYTALAEHWYRD
ncbi:lytic transglycosylase domain-containing protein [Gammaproteobacteria bacterium AB-CW1]|uniref:Lytic transglycosylase domain-containing protein n=1 Tax=Natronospira elongata TaxID=3110268 RepID=A0AAP6MM30_9GAMM|nr:lytic transglycosylase domain-containing protein [Gammaproteobacteria bacterium AB-CW1]